jgi:uncharacterized membrane protein
MNLKKRCLAVPLALGIILVLSFVLLFSHLGSRPLYGDEPYHTVAIAAKSLSYITTTNFGSTLYPLLLHFLLPLGETTTMARLPAALFGFLSVWGIFLLGKLFFKEKEGLLAALFLAVSTYLIYISRQARGYTGLLFFSVFSLYFFWRAVKENKFILWFLYVLCTVIGIYAHFFLLIIIPVHAFFIVILIFEKWTRKKPVEIPVTKKKFWSVALSVFFMLILTFLLYLPMKKTESLNLFYFFKSSLSNISKAEIFLNPVSLIPVVIKRLLCYDTWPFFFFVQLGLLLFGLAASLKNHGKVFILFLSYLSLPFFLFAMSNPPAVYLTPQDRKFIFILPLLFLLMAKGLTSLHSILAWAILALTRIKNPVAFKKGLWGFILLAILACQAVFLEDYIFYSWNFLSLKIDSETSAYIQSHVSQMEMLYSDDYLNKNTFLILQPLRYPDGSQKGMMIYESDYDYVLSSRLYQPLGFLAILNQSSINEEDVSRLGLISNATQIKKVSRYFIVHSPSGEKTLYDKMVCLMNFLSRLPRDKEKIVTYHLLLAKIHLLAKRNPEALNELESFDGLKSRPSQEAGFGQEIGLSQKIIQKLFCLKRERPPVIIQDALVRNIQEYLKENADQLLLEGKFDEALSLQKKAESLNSRQFESSLWFHLSLGVSRQKMGMANEAVREYKKALLLSMTPKDETYVLKKIIEIRGYPFGYFIWQKKGVCHLRWWSNEKGTFAGTIENSRSFRSLGEYHLISNDKYKHSKKVLVFQGIVEGGRIEGLDLFIKSHSRLTFSLKINGRKDIEERIIFLPQETHPQGMPFSLKE